MMTAPADPAASRPMSAEMRAQIIVDSIGQVTVGDYRKRVFEAAVSHIRAAVLQATGHADNRFYEGTELDEQP